MYRRTLLHAWTVRRWAWLVAARARRCRRLGIRYLHLSVPEKLSVYPDKAPGLPIDPSLSFGQELSRAVGDPTICLDAAAALAEGRANGETFLRTDSHWSSAGCRIAHDLICGAVGAPIRWRLEQRHLVVRDEFVGDLGVKLDPPPSERLERRIVDRDAVRVEANELVLAYERAGRTTELHRGARIVFRNKAVDPDPRRLVLFGDSYADFASHGLTAMLAETFHEVHFVWSTAIDWAYVERTRPDILLTEIAERFMSRVPSDRGYDNEAFAAKRLRQSGAPPSETPLTRNVAERS
jgi:hypothetical protein